MNITEATSYVDQASGLIAQFTGYVNSAAAGNHFMAAGILGALAFICRKLPMKLVYFIQRQYQYTYSIEWEAHSYNNKLSQEARLATFIEKSLINKKSRFKRSSRLIIDKNVVVEAMPSGYTRCIHGFSIFGIYRKNSNKDDSRSKLSVTCAIWNKNVIDNLIAEFNKLNFSNKIYTFVGGYNSHWAPVSEFNGPGTIAINAAIKKQLDDALDIFVNDVQMYCDNKIPHVLNLLYYGPPGTGKTTIAEYVAWKLNTSLFMLSHNAGGDGGPLGAVLKARPLVSEGKYPVLLMDDLDTIFHGINRNINANGDIIDSDGDDDANLSDADLLRKARRESFKKKNNNNTDLSNLLHFLQSPATPSGIVTVSTTNDIGALDRAIYRPARMHICCYVGDMDDVSIAEYYKDCYGLDLPEGSSFVGIRACDLSDTRNKFMKDPEGFLKFITEISVKNVKRMSKPKVALKPIEDKVHHEGQIMPCQD